MKTKGTGPKRYLNKAERTQLCVLGSFKDNLEERIKEWSKFDNRKVQLKWARTSLAFINKTLDAIINPLDSKEREILDKEIKRTHIVTKSTEEAIKEYKAFKEQEDVISVKYDDLYTVFSYAVDTCMKCTVCDYKSCELRDVFMRHNLEPVDPYADDTVCQYQYLDIGVNAYMDLVELESTGMLFRVPQGSNMPGFTVKCKAPLPKEYWDMPKIITN